MTVCAIVLAAGSGQRFGGRKQVELFRGRPVFLWTMLALEKVAKQIVMVGPTELKEIANRHGVYVPHIVRGGDSRVGSVLNGIRYAYDRFELRNSDVLLIVDGNRPLNPESVYVRCIELARTHGVSCPVVPLVDGVATIDEAEGTIKSIPDRSQAVSIQTPEAVRWDLLQVMLPLFKEERPPLGIVEAAVRAGIAVRIADGSPLGYKITHAYDIEVLDAIEKRHAK